MNRLTSINNYYNENQIIQPSFNFDDNATNIKYQSKKNRETLDDLILQRQKELNMAIKIKEDINKNIISKLEKILSKKFQLSKEDYIMLIDKFSLKSTRLSRENITNMIKYLKIKEVYNKTNETFDDLYSATTFKSNNQTNVSVSSNMNIEPITSNNINTPIDMEKISELADDDNIDIEFELQKLIQQRETEINGTINNKLPSIDNNQVKNRLNISNTENRNTINNSNNIPNTTNNMPNSTNNMANTSNIDKPSINNTQINTNINKYRYTDGINIVNDTHIMDNIKLDITDKKDVMAQTDLLSNNDKYDDSEKETINLMLNLLDNRENNLSCKINYKNSDKLTHIEYIELISCFINKNFYDKNNFKNYPYFIVKVKQFKDILYINGTSISGFCQIIFEKRGNYYTYHNSDKTFGIYKPEKNFVLEDLEIEIYTPEGEKIENIKSTENDKFNITLKIISQQN